jgi:hypothetical protein
MSELKKRHERWEYHNQQKLERLARLSQAQIRNTMTVIFHILSFLLYLTYGAMRWLIGISRILWIQPQSQDLGLQDAERQRGKLKETASFWVK